MMDMNAAIRSRMEKILEDRSTYDARTISQHMKERRLALGVRVNSRKICYLDTKFWLILRDSLLGRHRSPVHKEFLDLCCRLVEAERCLFPISESIFYEIMLQSDVLSRRETILLIDKLSQGVTILYEEERIALEYKHFLYSTSGMPTYSCRELIWTRMPFVLGTMMPALESGDEETFRMLQKGYFDLVWDMTLDEMMQIMYSSAGNHIDFGRMGSVAIAINRDKKAFAHENNSFHALFLSEMAGLLDVYSSLFAKLFADFYVLQSSCDVVPLELPRLSRNIVFNTFRLQREGTYLPTLKILCGLHAAMRWNANQKFEDNDVLDFKHAACALPYADYFFTEKKLAHMLTQKLTAYDQTYGCIVCSKVEDALEHLRQFLHGA